MKRVLLVNESSTKKSGYGKYGYNLLSQLRKRGFHVGELAFGEVVNPAGDAHIPWPIYFNHVVPSDPRHDDLVSDPQNKFGKWRFTQTVMHFKPDYVLTILDPWHSTFILTDPTRRYFNYINMPTADTFPLKKKWSGHYTSPDKVLCYSDWARDNMQECWPDLEYETARYGVNAEDFHPLDCCKKFRSSVVSEDSVVIGYTAKNQPRKMFGDVIRMFSKVLENHPNTFLHIHTHYPDNHGWEIPNILDEYGVANNVLFTYACNGQCGGYEIDLYKGESRHCTKCLSPGGTIKSVTNQITESQLNEIYNTWDIYFQGSCSEGAGMPVAEAAFCGIPTVVLDTTAMIDYKSTIGSYPIKANETYVFNEQGLRGHICMDSAVEVFDFLIPKGRKWLSDNGIEQMRRAKEIYTWDNVGDVWEQAINSIPVKNYWKKPKGVFDQVTKDNLKDLSSSDLLHVIQDVLGINDPYNIIKTCRMSGFESLKKHSPSIMDNMNNKEELIDQVLRIIKDINSLERIRVGEIAFKKEDYIQYAEIKEKVHG